MQLNETQRKIVIVGTILLAGSFLIVPWQYAIRPNGSVVSVGYRPIILPPSDPLYGGWSVEIAWSRVFAVAFVIVLGAVVGVVLANGDGESESPGQDRKM